MSANSGQGHVWRILRDVVHQLDPRALVSDAIAPDGTEQLTVRGIKQSVGCPGKVIIIAVGKASVPMAAGAMDRLGDRVSRSIAVTKAGIALSVDPPEEMEVVESDHPVPSERSLGAGAKIRALVEELNADDLVVMLISGGGSALIEDLVDGVDLDDLQSATEHLLRAGATINELNAVRRRISRLKGGRLARAAAPARVVNLIVSDVLNSPLQDIASGPTVEPPQVDETFQAVMKRAELVDGLPQSIRDELQAQQGQPEPWPENVLGTTILADAQTAARFAIDCAVGLGYRVQTLGFDFQGEAREFGKMWSTIARHVTSDQRAFPIPLALVGTGEMTVTVRGDGTGGRNTEMALAAAIDLAGSQGITICSFATDGDDGLSECAGGIVDGSSFEQLRDRGVDVPGSLNENDSAAALRSIDSVIDIGPTGTNVNDLYLALIQDTN